MKEKKVGRFRSILYTPSCSINGLNKGAHDADARVLDLEDSVPSDLKSIARKNCIEFINKNDSIKPVIVRINSIDTFDGVSDIVEISKSAVKPDYIMLTKINSKHDLCWVINFFNQNKIDVGIYVTVETGKAIANIDEIALSCDGLVFGSADYSLAIGQSISWDNMLYARNRIVTAAIAAGIPAIDTACFNIDAREELIFETSSVKDLGYVGKAAVHPKQVSIINDIFRPTKRELDWAQSILNAFVESKSQITLVSGNMIGPPFVSRAKKIIESADLYGVQA